jgi:DNA ligase-1
MRFADLAETSCAVAATRSLKEKTRLIADRLRGLPSRELDLAARFLAGQVRQERLDVGWSALSGSLPDAAAAPSPRRRRRRRALTVADVDDALAALEAARGAGSRTVRKDVLADLFARATAVEQGYLRGLVLGEVRHGALEGVVVQGIAAAAGVKVSLVRRALMLSGDLGRTAVVAMTQGEGGLRGVELQVFCPVQPMLAATSASVADAFDELGGFDELGSIAVDHKLDGARVQVHRQGGDVRVYTRSLRQVRRPEVVEVVSALTVDEVILDGEVIALGDDGRPQPFQQTMSAFGSGATPENARLTPFFFDCLRHDGRDLLDAPLAVRDETLAAVVGEAHRAPRRIVETADAAEEVFTAALASGHEGVVCKSLHAPYAAGRRGSAWRKVKPVHTLDLVVLAAEWGSGRRRGWLSNLHLGARDPDSGEYVMLGKTFKGLSDAMLAWQTTKLQELEVERRRHVVVVRPELVVEVAFDGVQTSTRYPGGVALRFARVKGYRPDKDAHEADTVTTVRAIREGSG